MKSDTKALLKLVSTSFVVALAVLGVLLAAVLGWLPKQTAATIAAVFIIAGGLVLGRLFARGLMSSQRRSDGD